MLHLGENDLCRRSGLALMSRACEDISTLMHWLPGTALVWSDLLQRCGWRRAFCCTKIERMHRKITEGIGGLVSRTGGSVVMHLAIVLSLPYLYGGDVCSFVGERCRHLS